MKKLILVAFGAVALFSSCKKNSATNSCSNTMASIAGTYAIVKVEGSLGGSFSDVTNIYLKACQLDDKATLNADGTAIYTDAGTKCSPEGSTNGTWSIASDGKININAGTIDLQNAELVSYDCTTKK